MMNKQETTEVITLLAGNYENISKKTTDEKKIMINTWYECLKDLNYKLVLSAVKKTIIESPYVPTIHDIRKNYFALITGEEKTSIEAWNEALTMISNGLYMTQEDFEYASDIVKRFFGSVNQVKQLAMVDMETINTVTKGQFLKQYETLKERKQKNIMLPEELKDIRNKLLQNFDVTAIGGTQ